MLMREERTLMQRVQMALVSAAIFASGVAARVVTGSSYQAVDLGLEGSLVMGMLGGYVTGLLAGVLISIPAMFNGELMSMVLFAAAGVLGGLLRDVAPDKEAIWKLTFPDQALFRLLRKRDLRARRLQPGVRDDDPARRIPALDHGDGISPAGLRAPGKVDRRRRLAGGGRICHHAFVRHAAHQDLEQQALRA